LNAEDSGLPYLAFARQFSSHAEKTGEHSFALHFEWWRS